MFLKQTAKFHISKLLLSKVVSFFILLVLVDAIFKKWFTSTKKLAFFFLQISSTYLHSYYIKNSLYAMAIFLSTGTVRPSERKTNLGTGRSF